MRIEKNITADGSTLIDKIYKARGVDTYFATIMVHGDFGSGTAKLQLSPDGGTTKIDLKDASNTVVSFTADEARNIQLGVPSTNTETLELYATLSGASNPDLNITLDNNR